MLRGAGKKEILVKIQGVRLESFVHICIMDDIADCKFPWIIKLSGINLAIKDSDCKLSICMVLIDFRRIF